MNYTNVNLDNYLRKQQFINNLLIRQIKQLSNFNFFRKSTSSKSTKKKTTKKKLTKKGKSTKKKSTKKKSTKKGKKKTAKRKKGQPKRALSAYFIWLNENRGKIKSENPGISFTEISKKGGELWRELSDKSVSIFIFSLQSLQEHIYLKLTMT